MVNKNEIGRYIPLYLLDNHMSASEFGKQIGACRATVYRWIDGKPMLNVYYIKLLAMLSDYLH